ncbi:MAG TPA: efflux RND transporter periplasmic adaptor subunit [Chthoniobacteraceae bacterium]|jgi:RND family efflux transporter MFP subunit|nr:efflux RND transporter periplasmic adaptor subunit [Chthoniobacteraceae bacterium]
MKKLLFILLLAAAAAGGWYYYNKVVRPPEIVLTGMVTTDEVIVSSQIQGRLQRLDVNEGDTVKAGELLAHIEPEQWQADVSYYKSSEDVATAQLAQARADQEQAQLTFQRERDLYNTKVESVQNYDQARTGYDAAVAHVSSLEKQIAANQAQWEKANVELGYTDIRAPISGIVDTRTALQGEVVNPGEAIVTLVDADDLWVRADVEETYIDRVRLGDRLKVRLPSGVEREGTVFYRGVDADYATQRDVSRTKRDIKTFEIRLRCDNRDRALALGMTAYVILPTGSQG